MAEELTETITNALLDLVRHAEDEDKSIRLAHVKQARKLEAYWHGDQHLFWDSSSMDWRVPTHDDISHLDSEVEIRAAFMHTVNIFKAHGESIIAALASEVPQVEFGPKNTDDPDDEVARKVADSSALMIAQQNKVHLLIIHALYLLSIEGMCASYTYHKSSEDFGTLDVPEYGTEKRKGITYTCENCGIVQDSNEPCPECGSNLTQTEGLEEEVPVQNGYKTIPKGREIIEVYGVQDIKVSAHIKDLNEGGYLILYRDVHKAQVREVYGVDVESGGRLDSEQSRYYDIDSSLVTVKHCWFKPWQFNQMAEEISDELHKMFPKGCYVAVSRDVILDWRPEMMKDHWKIVNAGPDRRIHADPLLKSLSSLQEVRNNLINFILMNVEYGVPSSYASSSVVDLPGQSQQEQLPGYTYPVGPLPPGRRLEDFFYTEKATTVPREATGLVSAIDTDAQFVSGSFPSVYGGAATGGSKTLGEYDKSRSYALQRLSLVWYNIRVWWGETLYLSVKSFKDNQIEDEFWTSRIGGEIQTLPIKKADFKGAFIHLEPEVSTSIPTSFSQKQAAILELANMHSEEIDSVLFSPENARLVSSYVGLKELKIPGEIQRSAQMKEVAELIRGEPIMGEGEKEGEVMPSIPVNEDIDDHYIHIEVLRNFLSGDYGRDLMNTNPPGFQNCMAHLRMHKMILAMQEVDRVEGEEEVSDENKEKPDLNKEEPV